jgi:hypothetical protein
MIISFTSYNNLIDDEVTVFAEKLDNGAIDIVAVKTNVGNIDLSKLSHFTLSHYEAVARKMFQTYEAKGSDDNAAAISIIAGEMFDALDEVIEHFEILIKDKGLNHFYKPVNRFKDALAKAREVMK